MRAVLDCNVLVSARLSPVGASALLLRAASQERFELIVSAELLGELTDVLSRERFRRWFSAEEADAFVAALRSAATFVDDPPAPQPAGVAADRAMANDARYWLTS